MRRTLRRRCFLQTTAGVVLAAASRPARSAETQQAELEKILSDPVLNLSAITDPVKITSIDLLKVGSEYLVRIRSSDGVEATTVANGAKMAICYPIFLKQVAPFFVGQDARELERLLWEVYRHQSNYKLQGLSFWVGVAAMEMAVLELLGRVSGRNIADFFGGRVRDEISVYVASSNRGNSPEAEVDHFRNLVSQSGAKAIKFRLGGRMSRNADSAPGRTEALIPLLRREFGDSMTLYGDANSSYTPSEAIRLGKLMEANGYGFFEEPCEFDDLWGTKEVADALEIPIGGGEQEYSLHRWRWTIENRAVDIVQPDLHYGGGLIRATQVARMAASAELDVVPHMSGGGLGYLHVAQFASFTPNIGPFMEFKGNTALPVHCDSSSLKSEQGVVRCPTGPGFGVEIDPSYIARGELVRL